MSMELHENGRGGIHDYPRSLQWKQLLTSVLTFGKYWDVSMEDFVDVVP